MLERANRHLDLSCRGVHGEGLRRSVRCVLSLLSLYLPGCWTDMRPAPIGQFTEFEGIGPIGPTVDVTRLAEARMPSGPYRAVPGDVLEFTMPSVLRAANLQEGGSASAEEGSRLICRIGQSGTVLLPVVGELSVAGLSLGEIEAAAVRAYYPAYAKTPPLVYAKIVEHETRKVSIMGAVLRPGVYSLRSDQMSLVSLLTEAGGIVVTETGGIVGQGASQVRIIHSEGPSNSPSGSKRLTPMMLEPTEGDGRSHIPGTLAAYASPGQHGGSEDLGVRLGFRPQSRSGAVGQLTADRDGHILLSETLDLGDGLARSAYLRKLASQAPGLSTVAVDRELVRLVSVLDHATDRALYGRGGADPDVRSRGIEFSRRHTLSGFVKPIWDVSMVVGGQAEETVVGRPAEMGAEVSAERTLKLPVRGLNIPFADVALREGDTVIVERLQPQVFTVIGLVTRPGSFPYPPEVQYNLAQAIGFAGGLDRVADPRYAVVYRLKADGGIAHVCVDISKMAKDVGSRSAMEVTVKPGDIVAIEQTPRTRTKEFLNKIFNFSVGAYVPIIR